MLWSNPALLAKYKLGLLFSTVNIHGEGKRSRAWRKHCGFRGKRKTCNNNDDEHVRLKGLHVNVAAKTQTGTNKTCHMSDTYECTCQNLSCRIICDTRASNNHVKDVNKGQ